MAMIKPNNIYKYILQVNKITIIYCYFIIKKDNLLAVQIRHMRIWQLTSIRVLAKYGLTANYTLAKYKSI